MEKEKHHDTERDTFLPFKDLKGHKVFSKFPLEKYDVLKKDIYQSGYNENYVIRGVMAKSGGRETWLTKKEVIESAKRLKLDFIELDKIFGIHVAPTIFVPSEIRPEAFELFEVTEKIFGLTMKDLLLLNSINTEIEQLLKSHFINIINYVFVKFSKREKIMGDIYDNKQYVYGNRKESKKPDLYLIDTDPHYIYLEELTEVKIYTEYLGILRKILESTSGFKEKFKIDFKDVESKIKEKYLETKVMISEDDKKIHHLNSQKAIEKFLVF